MAPKPGYHARVLRPVEVAIMTIAPECDEGPVVEVREPELGGIEPLGVQGRGGD